MLIKLCVVSVYESYIPSTLLPSSSTEHVYVLLKATFQTRDVANTHTFFDFDALTLNSDI